MSTDLGEVQDDLVGRGRQLLAGRGLGREQLGVGVGPGGRRAAARRRPTAARRRRRRAPAPAVPEVMPTRTYDRRARAPGGRAPTARRGRRARARARARGRAGRGPTATSSTDVPTMKATSTAASGSMPQARAGRTAATRKPTARPMSQAVSSCARWTDACPSWSRTPGQATTSCTTARSARTTRHSLGAQQAGRGLVRRGGEAGEQRRVERYLVAGRPLDDPRPAHPRPGPRRGSSRSRRGGRRCRRRAGRGPRRRAGPTGPHGWCCSAWVLSRSPARASSRSCV